MEVTFSKWVAPDEICPELDDPDSIEVLARREVLAIPRLGDMVYLAASARLPGFKGKVKFVEWYYPTVPGMAERVNIQLEGKEKKEGERSDG